METSTEKPQQEEIAFAYIHGKAVAELPKDLYIPPDALEVFLDAFEGPLDLLLYLIKKQNLDILDIPIARITEQYMEYIHLMQEMRFELAAEYLVMAAILAEIKSRMLLPRIATAEEDESDPRVDLIRRLQEYERYKKAASDIDELPRMERDFALAMVSVEEMPKLRIPPQVDLKEILLAFRDVLNRADLTGHHHIQREALSVRERMSKIMSTLGRDNYKAFHELFAPEEGRAAVVVTFLALMELVKEQLVDLLQNNPLDTIYIKSLAAI